MEKVDTWIITNLKCYGNSLIPKQLIKTFGKEQLQQILIEETGLNIVIRESMLEEDEYDDEDYNSRKKKKKKAKPTVSNYIAEEIKADGTEKIKNKNTFVYKKEYENIPVESSKESKGVKLDDILNEIVSEALAEDEDTTTNIENNIQDDSSSLNEQIKAEEKEIKKESEPKKEKRMSRNKLTDLNDHLFEQLERLNDDELTEEQLNKEISRSKAMQDIAKQIIDNSRVQLDATKMMMEYGDINEINGKNMSKYLPMIENKDK